MKSVIKPAPVGQLTVIVGPSDSGKSAIIRSLRLLGYNEPDGLDYMRVGASFVRVTAEYESGRTAIRERTKSKNQYRIIVPNAKEPQAFEGFGREAVPLEVQEITGMRPVVIGDLSLNLNMAEQLDTPFLGNKATSAPARAKVLDKLAGTEEISHAGKTVDADLRRRGQDEKRLKVELRETEVRIAGYDWLSEYEQRIERLEGLAVKIKATHERRDVLANLQEAMRAVDGKISQMQAVVDRWALIDAAESYVVRAEHRVVRRAQADAMAVRLNRVSIVIGFCHVTISRWACLLQIELAVLEAEEGRAIKADFEHKRDRIVALDDDIADCIGRIDAWQGVEQAELAMTAAQTMTGKRNRLDDIKMKFILADSAVRENQVVLKKLQQIEKVDSISKTAQSLLDRKLALTRTEFLLKSINREIFQAENAMLRWTGVHGSDGLHKGLCELVVRQINVSAMKKSLADKTAQTAGAREQIVLWENRVAELQGAYNDELVSLGVCPMCGGDVSLKKLKEAC